MKRNIVDTTTTADILEDISLPDEFQSSMDFQNLDDVIYNSSCSFDVSEIADLLLDNIDDFIFITDSISKNIVYINKPLCNELGIDGSFVGTCHKVLCNRDKPCSECSANHAIGDRFFVTSLLESKLSSNYIIKSNTIDIYNKTYNVNIAIKKSADLIDDRLATNEPLSHDVLLAPYANIFIKNVMNPDVQIYRYIECLGNDVKASFCAIYEFLPVSKNTDASELNSKNQHNSKRFKRSQIWIGHNKKGSDFKELDEELLNLTIKDRGTCWYECEKNNCRLFFIPLYSDDKYVGAVVLVNPQEDLIKKSMSVLHSIGILISSAISYRSLSTDLAIVSNRDSLTKLKNRKSLLNDVNALASSENIGVLFFNVNGLKQINSTLGLKNGDTILIKTASLLKQLLHNNDYIYRTGGDEFIGIYPNIEEHDFIVLSDMIKAFMTSDKGFSVSVGSHWTKTGLGINSALNIAETDMYNEKKLFYREHCNEKDVNRYRKENDFVLNIIEPARIQELIDNGSFKVLYQPKFKIQGKKAKISGAEALVRLIINGAVIPPDDFIPALESAHFAHFIDYYVFETICRRMRNQLDAGKRVLPVSCNFSRHTIVRPEFDIKLKLIMDKYDLSYDLIPLEVSEHTSTARHQELVAVTEQLSKEGFNISIDDFGTAHANIYTLADLAVNEVKFDKKLIDNLVKKDNEKLTTILSVLIDACKKLGIKTIAEGVELQEQNDILKELGCDEIQGYFYSKPIMCEEYYSKIS